MLFSFYNNIPISYRKNQLYLKGEKKEGINPIPSNDLWYKQ